MLYTTRHWQELGLSVHVAHEKPDAPWSKGKMLAQLARHWPEAETLILADADCLVKEEAIRETLDWVQNRVYWGTPYARICRLTQDATQQILSGQPANLETIVPPYRAVKGGGITILRREAWEKVRGIDARFVGWGGEDIAFGWALDTLVGAGFNGTGDLIHLWHPEQGPQRPVSRETMKLLARYRRARGRPDRMAALVAEIPVLSE